MSVAATVCGYKMRGRRPRWRWIWTGSGALLAAAALACALSWPTIFNAVLATQMTLSPTSLSYHKWVAPTVPIFLEMYMFNWTNSDQFPEEIPKFEELGPYRFREVRKHVNVTFQPHNSSVGYRTQRTWFFDESSNGSLSDSITTLNVIAASAIFSSRHWGYLQQKGLSMFGQGVSVTKTAGQMLFERYEDPLSAIFRSRHWGYLQQKGLSMGLAMFGQGVSVTKTAGQMLFEGYEDPLLDLAKSLPASTTGGAPPVDRFGWFYGRNNSIESDGYLEITSGADSGTLPGQILRWNHQETLPYYEGICSQLSGSAGEFLPRDLDESSTLTMFVPDLCRTVSMDYVDSGLMDGLSYHKFAMQERSFDNSSVSEENTCFCHGQCMWSGVMNVSACRFGSPAFLSLPHFLYADPELREAVEGMAPDPEKHSFYFAVEPKLGVPLDVAARFQFNVFIEPSKYVVLYENVPTMLFPIFWVQQVVTVGDDVIKEIRMVRVLSDWGGVVCTVLACTFATLTAIASCCLRPRYTKPNNRPKDEAELKLNSK